MSLFLAQSLDRIIIHYKIFVIYKRVPIRFATDLLLKTMDSRGSGIAV